MDVNNMRSRKIVPLSWSNSYLFRDPLGISTTTGRTSTGPFIGASLVREGALIREAQGPEVLCRTR